MRRKSDLNEPLLVLPALLSWQRRIVDEPLWHERLAKVACSWVRSSNRPSNSLTAPWHQALEGSTRSDKYRLRRRDNEATRIFRLLGMFRHTFCSDPRVKVYALQSLEQLTEPAKTELGFKPLTVDYRRWCYELTLSILQVRFVDLPPESSSRSKYRKLFLRMGFNDTTAGKFLEWTTADSWPRRPPPFWQLLDTLDFDYDHCRKVADLAREQSRRSDQPYARRWEQVSEAVLAEFAYLAKQREFWASVKRRWDAGEVVVLGKSSGCGLSLNEDAYWHLVGKHLEKQ